MLVSKKYLSIVIGFNTLSKQSPTEHENTELTERLYARAEMYCIA